MKSCFKTTFSLTLDRNEKFVDWTIVLKVVVAKSRLFEKTFNDSMFEY